MLGEAARIQEGDRGGADRLGAGDIFEDVTFVKDNLMSFSFVHIAVVTFVNIIDVFLQEGRERNQ